MTNVSNDLSDTVSKLVELTKQLSDAKSDIKILNQEEKKAMVDQGIDTINLRKGKINLRKSVRKGTMNKEAISAGLMSFFSGDEVKVEGALNAIKDNLQTKESTSLSLTGIKEKPPKDV